MPRRSRRSQTASPPRTASGDTPAPGQRLQKVLAAAGVASRRECEQLICDGRVEVDRQTVTELGTRVDPDRQEIRVDGAPVTCPRRHYYIVNKPAGVVSTNRDPQGRPRVIDLVPAESRLFTVGRLDRASEGLILVTNDGELANRLSHPRYGIPKTYRAKVLGQPSAATLEKLRKGVHLAEGVARVAALRVKGRHTRGSELEIVLTEGRNREIRRILARVGHKVLHLRRTALGPVRLGRLAVGDWRRLTHSELAQLRRSAERPRARKSAPPTGRASSSRTRSAPARGGPTVGKRRAAASQTGAGGKKGKRRSTGTSRTKSSAGGTVLDYEQRSSDQPARPVKKKRRRK